MKWPCFYGIDFATRAELIANGLTHRGDRRQHRRRLARLRLARGHGRGDTGQTDDLCTACFAGDYPIELPDESLLGKHLLEATLQSPTMGRALPVLNNP